MSDIIEYIKKSLDNNDKKIYKLCTYATLGVVAYVMIIVNLFTSKMMLAILLSAFVVLCIIEIFFTKVGGALNLVASVLFFIQITAMFTLFIITGDPDGFSVIWVCMLPLIGLFVYGRRQGTLLCFIMFALVSFLFWTPLGNSFLLYDYGSVMLMRFPILYLAFYAMAFIIVTITDYAYEKVLILQEKYKQLSSRDVLTELYNRQGMYSIFEAEFDPPGIYRRCSFGHRPF